eukprot:6175830-Pleurochrysis_carterae.AAC.2
MGGRRLTNAYLAGWRALGTGGMDQLRNSWGALQAVGQLMQYPQYPQHWALGVVRLGSVLHTRNEGRA